MNLKQTLEHLTMCKVYIDIGKECKVFNVSPYEARKALADDELLTPVKRIFPCLNEFNDLCVVIEA